MQARMSNAEMLAASHERSEQLLRTIAQQGGIRSGEVNRAGQRSLNQLTEEGTIRSIELTLGRNGGFHYSHYDIFMPKVKPNSRVYFEQVNEIFAHWFAGLVRGPITPGKLHSITSMMDKMGLAKREQEMILIAISPTYYRSEDYRALRRQGSKETRTDGEARATALRKLDENIVLRSSEVTREEKGALIDLNEAGKIRKAIVGGNRGSGTGAAREYGHYDLFKTEFRPGERVYFRKFNLAVARWLAQWIKQPVDSGRAKALSHALQRMGFEDEEAKLIIAIAYPGYYMTLQQAVSPRT